MGYPRIVFVDGPTGIGKDYFIDDLEDILREQQGLSVRVLRAVDFVLKEAPSEDRKYEQYETEEEKIESIFHGHIRLVEHAVDLLKDDVDHTDVVIINRSLITFLIYNLWQAEHEGIRGSFISVFKERFLELTEGIETMYLQLSLGPKVGIAETVQILLKRIQDRNDGKEIDGSWILKLVLFYHTRGHALDDVVTYKEVVESDDAQGVSEMFFTQTEEPNILEDDFVVGMIERLGGLSETMKLPEGGEWFSSVLRLMSEGKIYPAGMGIQTENIQPEDPLRVVINFCLPESPTKPATHEDLQKLLESQSE